MSKLKKTGGMLLLTFLGVACTDEARTTSPVTPREASLAVTAAPISGGSERIVTMLDACDPTTFDAAVGAGTCQGNGGGVTFQRFLTLLEANGSVGAWRFSPGTMNVAVGQTLAAINRGGETHTFTEVEHFGGGIIESLNQLSGNPVPAEECRDLDADDFVPPGGVYRDVVHEEGTELYQCCIHPWMRVTVHANHGG
jgi:plastocyanin